MGLLARPRWLFVRITGPDQPSGVLEPADVLGARHHKPLFARRPIPRSGESIGCAGVETGITACQEVYAGPEQRTFL